MKKYLPFAICLFLGLFVSAQTELPNQKNNIVQSQLEINNIPEAIQTSSSEGNRFQMTLSNTTNVTQNLTIKLSKLQPDDWKANFTINDSDYQNSAHISLLPGESNITINISPGLQTGIGRYKLKIWVNESKIPNIKNFILIHNITNLILSDFDASDSNNHLKNTLLKEQIAIGELSIFEMLKTFELGLLNDLKSIFLNIEDNDVAQYDQLFHYFTDFLDKGGNLFLSGSSFDQNIHKNQAYFYENYLGLDYKMASNITLIKPIPNSDLFQEISSPFYLNPNQYVNIFSPNQHETKPIFETEDGVSAIYTQLNNFKIIYLGFDINQVADPKIANSIIQETILLFNPEITSSIWNENFNNNITAFPNPTNDFIHIKLNQKIKSPINLNVINSFGQLILNQQISPNDQVIKIDVRNFKNGIYFYQVSNGDDLFSNQFLKN